MRDLLITAIIFGSVPLILFRPFVGIIMWTWISLMSPHRLAWGFAVDFPFAKVVGAATLIGFVISPQRKQFPLTRESLVLVVLGVWMLFTTVLALEQTDAWNQWDKVSKILLLVFITMALLTDRSKLTMFIWMVVLSVGFYGVKGGWFTIVNGGENRVFGPQGSFIEDNNHLALAMIMVIPLMRFLQLNDDRKWVKTGLVLAMVFTGVAVLGTQSRGGFLGISAMLAFMGWKGRRRIMFFAAAAVVIPLALSLMPQAWFDRMNTIGSYEQDNSAMGRINAWMFATNLALDRPVGGGFETFSRRLFATYAPNPRDFHDAHSIYFEILGEHGFPGLFLYLLLALLTWRTCSGMIRAGRRDPDLMWYSDLGRMCQVSMIGYASAGAFVGLAYFDLYYNVIAMVVVAKLLLTAEEAAGPAEERADAPAGREWGRPVPVGYVSRQTS